MNKVRIYFCYIVFIFIMLGIFNIKLLKKKIEKEECYI